MGLNIRIVTPDGEFMNDQFDSLTTSTTEGQITILDKHAPLVAPLDYCELYTKSNGTKRSYALGGGVLYVSKDGVKIITDSIIAVEDIDVAAAEKMKADAEAKIHKMEESVTDIMAKKDLLKAINQLRLRK